jgi:hypothetical protein
MEIAGLPRGQILVEDTTTIVKRATDVFADATRRLANLPDGQGYLGRFHIAKPYFEGYPVEMMAPILAYCPWTWDQRGSIFGDLIVDSNAAVAAFGLIFGDGHRADSVMKDYCSAFFSSMLPETQDNVGDELIVSFWTSLLGRSRKSTRFGILPLKDSATGMMISSTSLLPTKDR